MSDSTTELVGSVPRQREDGHTNKHSDPNVFVLEFLQVEVAEVHKKEMSCKSDLARDTKSTNDTLNRRSAYVDHRRVLNQHVLKEVPVKREQRVADATLKYCESQV